MIRFFDISFSALALTMLSPLLLPIILILRFSGEGEVFFTKIGLVKISLSLDLLSLQQCLRIVRTLVQELLL